MKRILLAAGLLVFATAANAQTPATVRLCTGNPCVPVSDTNPLPSGGGGSSTSANQGTAGTNAQSWWVQIGDGVNGPADIVAPLLDGLAPGALLGTFSQNYLYNGTSLSLQRDMPGASLDTGFGVAAVHVRPNSSANGAITPVVTSASATSLVLKASAGNLYSVFAANQGGSAGFLVVLNAVSAPVDGAITPLECAALPANGNATISYGSGPPSRFSSGITAVLTTAANCFTKTTGAVTGFIRGSVQ